MDFRMTACLCYPQPWTRCSHLYAATQPCANASAAMDGDRRAWSASMASDSCKAVSPSNSSPGNTATAVNLR